MPPYLRPMGPTASNAILCGDPARALAIAQRLLTKPRMSNHHRGLWGYHGETVGGEELSVQATGIGGPSAALVLSLLAERGLRAAVRVGSARSPAERPALGSRVAATAVRAGDGASVAYGAEPGARLLPDPALAAALEGACEAGAELTSLDRPRDLDPTADAAGLQDLQSAALLAAARASGVRLAVGVVVSRNPLGPLADESHDAAALRLAEDAAAALGQLSTSGRG